MSDEEDREDNNLDDGGQEDKDSDVDKEGEVEKDSQIWKSNINTSKVGYCNICGVEIIVDELPDSISRDAFKQFGICLNCQWGIFMQNGGHF